MLNARTRNTVTIALAVSCLTAAFVLPGEIKAAAGGVQSCTVGATCKIGEFLYDDTSAPIAGATCTITSKYPNNTSYLSSQPMSGGGSDGWYYYEFTTPSTTGVYATNVCCTTSGDTLCIDKGFEAALASSSDPSSIATAVWSYSGRTVTSFGNLIADIWANATRTLTGSGLSSGQLATQDDVVSVRNNINNLSSTNGDLSNIKKSVDETRLMIEKVVNKPIIQNFLEDTNPDVSQKIKDTKVIANQLYINNQFLTTQTATLASKWVNLSGEDALSAVIALSNTLGEPSDSASANTMFGQVNYLKYSWNWDEALTAYNKLIVIEKRLTGIKEQLADYNKSTSMHQESKLLVKDSLALEKIVGSAFDKPSQRTIFTKINSTEALAASLDDKKNQIDKVIVEYGKNGNSENVFPKIVSLQNQVVALNKVPSISTAISKAKLADEKSIKNALFSLRGIVDSNKKFLALSSGKTLVNTWLEMGSIVFKTLATNPSTLITQDVEIKYYLPPEIKQENVIKVDPGLEVKYDAEKDQLYAEGTFKLSPGQTRTFSIETTDIWEVTPKEIASLRTQAEELFKPLEKTAYFAQAVSLKSDINAALDQAEGLQASAVTPEDKIRAYREAEIFRKSAEDKLAGLKDLVTQASAAGNLFGFVGGSQTIAVWGLVMSIVAAFVFMITYMRTMLKKGKKAGHEPKVKTIKIGGINPFRFAMTIIATSIISAGATGFFISRVVANSYEEKLKVLGTQTQEKSAEEKLNDASTPNEKLGVGGVDTVKIVVPHDEKLGVYEDETATHLVMNIKASQNALRIEENNEMTKVSLSDGSIVWVKSVYIKDGKDIADDTDLVTGTLVRISNTPTGWLRVRDAAGLNGEEIAQVKPGENYALVSEESGWYQIILSDGNLGWISAKYASKTTASE